MKTFKILALIALFLYIISNSRDILEMTASVAIFVVAIVYLNSNNGS